MEDTKPIYLSILERQIELTIKAKLVKMLRDDTAKAFATITDHEYEHDALFKEAATEYLLNGMSLSDAIKAVKVTIAEAEKVEVSDG